MMLNSVTKLANSKDNNFVFLHAILRSNYKKRYICPDMTTTPHRERIHYLDAAKGILILLLLLHHFQSATRDFTMLNTYFELFTSEKMPRTQQKSAHRFRCAPGDILQ